jgi:leucyl-tRNA---protein transferase
MSVMTEISLPVTIGPCPYLATAPAWRMRSFTTDKLDPGYYEQMLGEGFRRNGQTFYVPSCEGCSKCIPIRVDANSFTPSKSQRRIIRKNTDISVTAEACSFSEERFKLYKIYSEYQHGERKKADSLEKFLYADFLISTPFESVVVIDYWVQNNGKQSMCANGYLDVLPNGLSSIYFVWAPDQAKRSLGVFSINEEIRLCKKTGKRWYYLGFWVPGSPKMDYKADYGPAEIAINGNWVPLDETMKKELRS